MLRSKVVCAVSSSGRGYTEGLPVPPSTRTPSTRQRSSMAASQTTVEYAPPPPVLKSPPVIHTTAYLQQTQQLVVGPIFLTQLPFCSLLRVVSASCVDKVRWVYQSVTPVMARATIVVGLWLMHGGQHHLRVSSCNWQRCRLHHQHMVSKVAAVG